MEKNVSVLVSGASGIIGYGILRSLRSALVDVTLYGSSIYPQSAALGFSDKFLLAPKTNSAEYIDWLKDCISRHDLRLIIPGIEADMYKWNENRDEILSTGVKIGLNSSELIELCHDKWSFYHFLVECGSDLAIKTSLDADFEHLSHVLGLPFLLKPRVGHGSKGILKIDSREIWLNYVNRVGPELMAQEIVGDDESEYSSTGFGDGIGGFYCSFTLRRKLSPNGFTEWAEVVSLKQIEAAVIELGKIFSPFGPTNFQFRMHQGKAKLLEINPRISSSTSIRSGFGYNESKMLFDWLIKGTPPKQPVVKNGWSMRFVDELFFYK